MVKDDKKEQKPTLKVKKDFKIDLKNLPELKYKNKDFGLPKPPPILGKKREESDLKNRKAFSLASEYDLSTYKGRFQHMFSRINPL